MVQKKVVRALEGEKKLPETLTTYQNMDMQDLEFSTLTSNLSDKILRKVSSKTTGSRIWVKLESLYMTTSLQDRIYLKGKLFGCR